MIPAELPSHGIEPLLRPELPGFDSGVMTLMVVCFVVNALLFPTLFRLWRHFFKELALRRLDGMVEDHTLGERWAMAVSLVQTVVFEGLALLCAVGVPAGSAFAALGGCILLALLLMVVQIGGYLAVGYAFAPPGQIRLWMRAFFATQSILGYLLVIPAMGALFYPAASLPFLAVCVALFVACRILFYIKCFRIFYTHPASLFYFFLYLCTLEIVPPLAAWLAAPFFSQLFC